jgi:hypothetical protein
MKPVKPLTQNVAISNETHSLLVSHVQENDLKLGKFADKAIREKIEHEIKKSTR